MFDEIRRSQIITTFGIGSITDLKDYSGILKSPDVWRPNMLNELEIDQRIDDPRLADMLGVQFFVMPPPKTETGYRIPFTLFPRMLYCPKCKRLRDARYWFPNGIPKSYQLYCDCLRSVSIKKKRTHILPSRFIVICPKGHLEDFPYEKWVHKYQECSCSNQDDYYPDLEYHAIGGGASLEDIKIKCRKCGKTRSMAGALTNSYHDGFRCAGNKPELFDKRPFFESCNASHEHVRFVLRGASNVYFPKIYSSLLIPPFSGEVAEIIQMKEEFKTLLRQKKDGASVFDANKSYYISKWSEEFKLDSIVIVEIVDNLLSPKHGKLSLEEFKLDEYRAFNENVNSIDPNFKNKEMLVNALRKFKIDRLIKSLRLREIRVLSGYSRVKPYDSNTLVASDITDAAEQSQMSISFVSVAPRTSKTWLPGIEVFGEGIFLRFSNEMLTQEENKNQLIIKRMARLSSNINSFRLESGFSIAPINARFVALHTLSHILLKRIAFESGYQLASLRERIYCNIEAVEDTSQMNGILIYTADTDTEGTLGGLSRLANDIIMSQMIQDALDESEWCSSDPVCRESSGQGMGSLNLAACHSCCLIPETCCEHGNRFLDRTLMDLFFGE